MFSNELSANDMDYISFCDNSVYVLPPKTELNSSFYIQNNDLSNFYGNKIHKDELAQRKISNNVDIPTYKGFSVAKDVSQNSRKRYHAQKFNNVINHIEKDNVSRKVHSSSGKSIINNEFQLMKSSSNIKLKLKLKLDEQKFTCKYDKPQEKSNKRVETFLGQYNYIRYKNNVNNILDNNNNKTCEEPKVENNVKIKKYMSNKRNISKKIMDENKLKEKEKKEQIEGRLKSLSEKAKLIENHSNPIHKSKEYHQERKSFVKIPVVTQIQEEDVNDTSTDQSTNDKESTAFCESIKQKLAKWTPMDDDELELHRLDSQNYMKSAIATNRYADNILSNIIDIGDKMKIAQKELLQYVNRAMDSDKNANSHMNRRKVLSESNSISQSVSEEFSIEEDNYSQHFRDNCSHKNPKNNKIRKEVAPLILANRARRKLDLYENDKYENDESDNSASAYDDCIARLIEENQKRYEKSLETNQPILLPFHRSVPKPMVDNRKDKLRKKDIIKSLENDSLTFMKTYRRYKHDTNINYKKSLGTNTNHSRITHESIKLISSSHRSSRQSIQVLNSVDLTKSKKSQELTNDYQYTTDSDSDTQKSNSADISINVENVHSSNAFSEVEVTIDNSTSVNQYSDHQPTQYKVPHYDNNIPNTELRMSPNSLERKLYVELHHLEGIQASMEQLLQADRFQGVGFAQQETVSLAQILKARQWKDVQDNESNNNIQKFTTALENLNKINFRQNQKISPSTTSSISNQSSTIKTDSSSHLLNRKGKSTTESEASEIEEEIVDFSISSESHKVDYVDNRKKDSRQIIQRDKNIIKSTIPSKLPQKNRNKLKKYPDSVVEIDIHQSKTNESIREISTVQSLSYIHETENSESSSKDTSIVESIATVSSTTKTATNITNASEMKDAKGDLSSVKTFMSMTNATESEKSLKEISTSRSLTNENKSQVSSSISKPSTSSKSETKSSVSNSVNQTSNQKSEIQLTNYSKDEFDTNSEYQKSTSESEVINRVNLLENEKQKKEKLIEKLKHKLTKVKERHKEKSLKNHINHLDSQIKVLKNELENPNLSITSLSLSPIVKANKSKTHKEINILPNRKSSSSSSTSISKDEDNKSTSISTSISSSTLISDAVKDKSQSINEQIDKKEDDIIDTPRSSRQIQFEDINEEYSASNQDSSELKTPSEKSHLSKEITENGITKSKSENFHVLVLDKPNDDDEQDSINNENEDLKMISARTIHSEISEIPMEGEGSDQEIDDFFDKIDDSEKNKNNSYQDQYSEDFSDITSHHTARGVNTSQSEINEISKHDEIFSYEPSPESSISAPPVIPPRRKGTTTKDVTAENVLDPQKTIGNICDNLFSKLFNEILTEDFYNKDLTITNHKVEHHEIKNNLENIKSVDSLLVEDSNENVFDGSVDSLNDLLTDIKYAPLGRLILWNNDIVLPLVDIAIEHLFTARQRRLGSTLDAFNKCCENMPHQFNEINSEAEITRIHNHWKVYRARDNNLIDIHKLYISRSAIYNAVLEIMINIYELDDEPVAMPWMKYAFNAIRQRKLILWQGSNAPNSLDIVNDIVKKQLAIMLLINNDQPSKYIKRSRQHQWFLKQTSDFVDKLLIDETFQDDVNWVNYDNAIEKTIYMITDEILANELMNIVYSVGGYNNNNK